MTGHWPRGVTVTRLYEEGSLALSLIRSSGETRAHRSPSARPAFLTVCRLLYSADSFHSASPAEFCSAYLSPPSSTERDGQISPDDRREEPRDSPATKSSGCLSARFACREAIRLPDERSEEPCEARSQEVEREPRRVSTGQRSLPKAVAIVAPQGAERALCVVQICRDTSAS